jgi:electron transfer flavoprotein alpha subunit
VSDIWVVADSLEGNISAITFEMLGKAKELASEAGSKVVAVSLGKGASSRAGSLGAADVIIAIEEGLTAADSPEQCGKALAAVAKERSPRLMMLANSATGMDLAGYISGNVGWPLVAYCKDIKLDGNSIVATSQLYGGKILAESVSENPSTVVTVLPGSFPEEEGLSDSSPSVENPSLPDLGQPRVRFKGITKPEAGDVDITKEVVVVCVGRGIGSQDDIEVLEELAEALGAALAASRPIVDNGWLPKTRQVGKSGLTVKPKVYIAVGVSGAPEHIEGMADSSTIIAVNTDEGAPIIGVAHYGVAGDLFDVIPALTERIQNGA